MYTCHPQGQLELCTVLSRRHLIAFFTLEHTCISPSSPPPDPPPLFSLSSLSSADCSRAWGCQGTVAQSTSPRLLWLSEQRAAGSHATAAGGPPGVHSLHLPHPSHQPAQVSRLPLHGELSEPWCSHACCFISLLPPSLLFLFLSLPLFLPPLPSAVAIRIFSV